MDNSLGHPVPGCKMEYCFPLCILCVCTAGSWKQRQSLAMSLEGNLVGLGVLSDFLFVMWRI